MSNDSMKSRKVNWPKRIKVGLATTLMALFALKACVFLFSPMRTATLVRGHDCPSPTGALVATHLILMGGGAAGWVEHTVSIRAPSDSLDLFGQLPLHSHRHELRFDWKSDRDLTIVVPDSSMPANPPPFWVLDSGDTIQLTFESRPGTTEQWKTGYFADPLPGCPVGKIPGSEYIDVDFPCGYDTRCPGADADWILRPRKRT